MLTKIFVEETTKEGLKVLTPMEQEIAIYPIGTEVDFQTEGSKDPETATIVGFNVMCMSGDKSDDYESFVTYYCVNDNGDMFDVLEEHIVFYVLPQEPEDEA